MSALFEFGGDVIVEENLVVQENVTIQGDTIIQGPITVNNSATFSQPVTFTEPPIFPDVPVSFENLTATNLNAANVSAGDVTAGDTTTDTLLVQSTSTFQGDATFTNAIADIVTTNSVRAADPSLVTELYTNATTGINIGTGNGITGVDQIILGGPNTNVFVPGTETTVNVENLTVTNKVITLNNNGPINSGFGSGIQIEEGDIVSGYIVTNGDRTGFLLQAPNNEPPGVGPNEPIFISTNPAVPSTFVSTIEAPAFTGPAGTAAIFPTGAEVTGTLVASGVATQTIAAIDPTAPVALFPQSTSTITIGDPINAALIIDNTNQSVTTTRVIIAPGYLSNDPVGTTPLLNNQQVGAVTEFGATDALINVRSDATFFGDVNLSQATSVELGNVPIETQGTNTASNFVATNPAAENTFAGFVSARGYTATDSGVPNVFAGLVSAQSGIYGALISPGVYGPVSAPNGIVTPSVTSGTGLAIGESGVSTQLLGNVSFAAADSVDFGTTTLDFSGTSLTAQEFDATDPNAINRFAGAVQASSFSGLDGVVASFPDGIAGAETGLAGVFNPVTFPFGVSGSTTFTGPITAEGGISTNSVSALNPGGTQSLFTNSTGTVNFGYNLGAPNSSAGIINIGGTNSAVFVRGSLIASGDLSFPGNTPVDFGARSIQTTGSISTDGLTATGTIDFTGTTGVSFGSRDITTTGTITAASFNGPVTGGVSGPVITNSIQAETDASPVSIFNDAVGTIGFANVAGGQITIGEATRALQLNGAVSVPGTITAGTFSGGTVSGSNATFSSSTGPVLTARYLGNSIGTPGTSAIAIGDSTGTGYLAAGSDNVSLNNENFSQFVRIRQNPAFGIPGVVISSLEVGGFISTAQSTVTSTVGPALRTIYNGNANFAPANSSLSFGDAGTQQAGLLIGGAGSASLTNAAAVGRVTIFQNAPQLPPGYPEDVANITEVPYQFKPRAWYLKSLPDQSNADLDPVTAGTVYTDLVADGAGPHQLTLRSISPSGDPSTLIPGMWWEFHLNTTVGGNTGFLNNTGSNVNIRYQGVTINGTPPPDTVFIANGGSVLISNLTRYLYLRLYYIGVSGGNLIYMIQGQAA